MPTINKNFTLFISPELFLDNCSDIELVELDLLIQSERYQRIIQTIKHEKKQHLNLYRSILQQSKE